MIFSSMFFMHPAFLCVSLAGACAYSIVLNRRKAARFQVMWLLPMLAIIALLNPLLNHEGRTVLAYFGNNPLTRESLLYGVASAVMFVTVILWFSCYNIVMTSDKFIFLFGKIIPSLSLVFSMVLRFVPRFQAQIALISTAQKCVGRDPAHGSLANRAKSGLKILAILTTWAIENAMITADSMRSRGYGLKGRTSFSVYRFDKRDARVCILFVLLVCTVAAGAITGENRASYFPSIQINPFTPRSIPVFAAYSLLCTLPLILRCMEELKWRRLKSNI